MPKPRFQYAGKACLFDRKTKNFITPQTTARYLNLVYNTLLQAKADFIYIDKHQLDSDPNLSIDLIDETLKQLQ